MSTTPIDGEASGRRLWLWAAAVVVAAACLESYGITSWPMADDEVPSLVELGLLHIGAEKFFSVPVDQIEKLPKATPVWNAAQRFAIGLLPATEVSYRIPSLVFGIATSAILFLAAARWRGLWCAVALAIVVHGSQPFVYLVQLNRFYSLAMLLLTLTVLSMWLPRRGVAPAIATGALSALAVLSHSVMVAVFALAFVASCATYVVGRGPKHVVWRSGVAAAVGVLIHAFYLRPLVQGWSSTGNPQPILVSFAAHAGIPALALALLGCWLMLVRRDREPPVVWWTLMFAGSLCLFEVTTMNWNPRYFLFFLPAVWVLAAHAMEFVARAAGTGSVGAAWYTVVAILLLPGMASHYRDGSRHDYRQAAAVLAAHVRPGQPILSDDAETITYYLPAALRSGLEVRTRVRQLPAAEFYVVYRSNAWAPVPQVPGRQMELLSNIGRRRYDQFSHVLRVFRVAAAP